RRQGKFREAKNMLEPLVEHLRSTGNKSLLGSAMTTLGSIAEAQAEMPTELRMYQDASALFKDMGDKTEYAGAERYLGKALLSEGDIAGAKQALSEALSVDREIGAKADAALTQVALAQVALAQGEPLDAGTLQSAVDELRLRKITDDEIEAEIILARGLMQQGKISEAANILRLTTVLSAKSYDPTVRLMSHAPTLTFEPHGIALTTQGAPSTRRWRGPRRWGACA